MSAATSHLSNWNVRRNTALVSASWLALSAIVTVGVSETFAQNAPASSPGATQLPTVSVEAARPKPKKPRDRSAAKRTTAPAPAPVPNPPAINSQDARTGTSGVYANSTSVATKTNTPLINIPQSVNVLTKSFIKDQSFQSIDDAVRYVPGVVPHQGEGNRDELVIRGVDSSANFFVNGFRDDVQFFRDLYNVQSIEVLKGPSALTFGRGSGGGVLNRTLKEADGTPVKEVTLQTGSWLDRRTALDVGQAVNQNIAVRLNAFYEGSDTFRDYGWLTRYGVNPTMTMTPNDDTKIKLSYEYAHDRRLADRGNPSQGLSATAPASTRFNPAAPFVSDFSTFFGSPFYNLAHSDVHTVMGVIEHDFGHGLSVKNSTLYASYDRGYRNIYPGNGPLSGAVNPADTAVNLAAYQNSTNRDNLFNQTDFIYKTATGPVLHTVAFGTEFGTQSGLSRRDTGFFPGNGNANTIVVNPFSPTFFGPVNFIHIATDANSKYRANVASGYAQDQIEVTRWLQLFAGARYDRFDLTALDQNTNIERSRVDEKISPRAAIILKPVDNLSVYTAYSVSYLPASGDQFSTLNNGTLILEPQKFENKEVGVKWNIEPRLQYTAAVYDLKRTNAPLADPNNPGFFILSGSNRIRGFETNLNGYVTSNWQSVLGYSYTDARVTSDTSATIVAGNRVQLVPYHQVAAWNKYQFNPVWAAALGVIYFSDSFASSDDSVRLPGFVRFDAAIYARINETWRAQFNVENIFDKGYWATADGNNNLSPGQSRTFRLTAIANF
ncbi:MAG: TonB-dependent receptor [Xanthobacteraceae bacterium]